MVVQYFNRYYSLCEVIVSGDLGFCYRCLEYVRHSAPVQIVATNSVRVEVEDRARRTQPPARSRGQPTSQQLSALSAPSGFLTLDQQPHTLGKRRWCISL